MKFVLAYFTFLLMVVGTGSLAQTNCAPPGSGLVSWWTGEADAQDGVSGNNGTLHGGVSIAPGEVGNGFGFDGTGYIIISNSPTLSFTNQLTIELWYMSMLPTNVYYTLIDKRVGATLANYGINYAPLNGLGVFYDDPTVRDGDDRPYGSAFEVSRYSPAPGPGAFHHLAATYQQLTNSQVQLQTYLDGQLVRTKVIKGNLSNTLNTSPVTIGAGAQGAGEFFQGVIDEISIYDRVLDPAEILAIYKAGSTGKCAGPIPPTILGQPQGLNAPVGNSANFTVVAAGSVPLSYQWQKNGGILDGATGSTLTINNAQLSDAGSYSVIVSNAAGTVTSSNASLTVNAAPPCLTPPPGLLGWWKGDNNANDSVGGNNGSPQHGARFDLGEVGQAFAFSYGTNEFVEIPDAPVLNPSNAFTIETWVYVSAYPMVDLGAIVTKQNLSVLQYQLLTHYVAGRLRFRPVTATPGGLADFDGNTMIQLNTWYHVAMTYDSSSLKLYVNGGLDGSVAATGPIARTSEPLRIGGVGTGPWDFAGRVDELSMYDRALSISEVRSIYNAGVAGKCVGPVAPSFVTQPQSQSATVGSSLNFAVTAGGSLPLSYQWIFNGTPILGATTNSLTLNSVSQSSAGSYSVVVTNVAGSATSSVAVLTVTLPPATIQLAGSSVGSDGTVTVPVNLVANGNENAVSFSLTFDPTFLSFQSVVLGNGASGASLWPNPSQAATGQVGVAMALDANVTFGAGTQQVALVSFSSPIVASSTSTTISFGDAPIKRLLADIFGNPLTATFASATLTLPPTQLEGDVYPRPNGDEALTISDWVLVGRYVARLDYPTNALEFQKADCAPRATLGDGLLTVGDWVQAGRYAAGLDPVTRAGGPASAVPAIVAAPAASSAGVSTESNPREVKVLAPALAQGQIGTVEVALEAQGNENALAFSLSFDPAKLVFTGATIGEAAKGTTLNLNTNQAAQGRLGCVLAFGANRSFPAGSKQLLNASFRATTSASGNAVVSFADLPVPRGVSDQNASALAADYIAGTVVLNPLPSLRIVQSAKSISLSWPASAVGFVMQESSDPRLAATSWITPPITPAVVNNEDVLLEPLSATDKFYRLYHP